MITCFSRPGTVEFPPAQSTIPSAACSGLQGSPLHKRNGVALMTFDTIYPARLCRVLSVSRPFFCRIPPSCRDIVRPLYQGSLLKRTCSDTDLSDLAPVRLQQRRRKGPPVESWH